MPASGPPNLGTAELDARDTSCHTSSQCLAQEGIPTGRYLL